MKNCKIRTRLIFAFGLCLLFLMGNGILAVVMIQKLDSHIDALANDRLPKVEQANQIVDNLNVIARVLRNVVIDTNPARQQEELKRLAASRETIGKTLDDLQKKTTESEGQAKLQNVIDRRKAYIQQTDNFVEHVKKGDYDQAKTLLFTLVRIDKILFCMGHFRKLLCRKQTSNTHSALVVSR